MYSGPLRRPAFQPDQSSWRHAAERQEYMNRLRQEEEKEIREEPKEFAPAPPTPKNEAPVSLSQLLDLVSPEDSALIALIVFLLCDNTNNDVVLLGILLYVLLSK